MNWLESIRTKLIERTTDASVRLESRLPLSQVSHLYQIQHAAERLSLRGWLQISKSNVLQAELEGTVSALQKLLVRIEAGRIVPEKIKIDAAWSPCWYKFKVLTVRLAQIVVHTRNSPDDHRLLY